MSFHLCISGIVRNGHTIGGEMVGKKKRRVRELRIKKCVAVVTQTKDSLEIVMSLLSACVCPYQVGNTSFFPPYLTSELA